MYLLTLTLPRIPLRSSWNLLKFYEEVRKHNFFYFSRFIGKVPKDGRSQFLANLLITELFQKRFWSFLPTFKKHLFKWTLLGRCSCLWGKVCIGQALNTEIHFYHLLKTPNYIALFISPDEYDITVNRKENANVLLFLMFHISRKQSPASVC